MVNRLLKAILILFLLSFKP